MNDKQEYSYSDVQYRLSLLRELARCTSTEDYNKFPEDIKNNLEELYKYLKENTQ